MPVASPIRNRLYQRLGGQDDPYAPQGDTPPPPQTAAPGTPPAAPPAPPPPGSGNSPGELSAINAGLGFPNFNASTGLNNDGSTVVGPNGDPSHQSQPRGSAQDFIRNYQASHPISASSVDDLTAALAAAGYTNTSRYMYGSTPSGNELNVDGQKYKVRVDGGGWYTGGDDSAPAGVGGAVGAAGPSPFQQQIRDLLMQQLGGLSKPVTADDPAIANEMQAQGRLLERNRQDRRAASAERAAADGLLNGGQGSGSFESDVASGYEDKGNQLSSIQSQLFNRELQSRRDKVAQLLSMAMQSGDAESARSLQMQMAQMDNQLRQSQWNDQFGLNAAQFQYGKDRDVATAGLRP